jgi:hypothetical protein
MRTVPIYLNNANQAALETNKKLADTLSFLGIKVSNWGRSAIPMKRHSFLRRNGILVGTVIAPEGSRMVETKSGMALMIPTPSGNIELSAADVIEQAREDGGCGLKLVEPNR